MVQNITTMKYGGSHFPVYILLGVDAETCEVPFPASGSDSDDTIRRSPIKRPKVMYNGWYQFQSNRNVRDFLSRLLNHYVV